MPGTGDGGGPVGTQTFGHDGSSVAKGSAERGSNGKEVANEVGVKEHSGPANRVSSGVVRKEGMGGSYGVRGKEENSTCCVVRATK